MQSGQGSFLKITAAIKQKIKKGFDWFYANQSSFFHPLGSVFVTIVIGMPGQMPSL
jgi:hypothetical protein